METKQAQFFRVYEEELNKAVRQYPDDYAFPPSKVPEVVERMKAAFLRQSYNKDGQAIKATCKQLGIKYTYKAINEFIQG